MIQVFTERYLQTDVRSFVRSSDNCCDLQLVVSLFTLFLSVAVVVKGAARFYFTHYAWVVIILVSTGLYESAFPTDSFGKLGFCLSALCIRYNLHKLYNICIA